MLVAQSQLASNLFGEYEINIAKFVCMYVCMYVCIP